MHKRNRFNMLRAKIIYYIAVAMYLHMHAAHSVFHHDRYNLYNCDWLCEKPPLTHI